MNDLISVIVPVFNVESYLKKSVDSILRQTYENIEVILVDDGSTDASGEICDSYAEIDDRITVIHKENGGLSDARNAGIDILKGKYVAFVDSDDWVEPTYIEQLYKLLVENGADISICSFYYIDSENNLYNSPKTDGRVFVWNREEALYKLLITDWMSTAVWNKLYRADIFNKDGMRFPVGRLFEDIPVTYAILLCANKVAFCNCALYNYLMRPQSISTNPFSPQKMHAVEHMEAVVPQIMQQFPQFGKLCAIALFRVNFSIYLTVDEDEENRDYKARIIEAVKKNRNAVIFSKDVNIKWRIKAVSTYLGLPVSRAFFARRIKKGKKRM